MIIKSITHTSNRASISNLITYVFGDKDMVNEKGESVTIKNLLTGGKNTWAKQFQKVEQRRTSFYAGKEVRYYHEILSFSPKSKPTKEELEDIIWHYLNLRLDSPTKAFAGVHFSKSHFHIHLTIQGIDCYGKSIRMSKTDFKEKVQVQMNKYQSRNYPHLSDSYIDYSSISKNRKHFESHNAYQRKKRTGEKTQKEILNAIISDCFLKANSEEAFIAELAKQNVDTSYRSGKLNLAIFNGREYRFRHTLGVDFSKLLKPSLRDERRRRLKAIEKKNKENSKFKSK